MQAGRSRWWPRRHRESRDPGLGCEETQDQPGPIAHFAAAVARYQIGVGEATGGGAVHDALAVGAVIDPTLLQTKFLRVDVDLTGDFARGETVANRFGTVEKNIPVGDHWDTVGLTKIEPNVHVAVGGGGPPLHRFADYEAQRKITRRIESLRLSGSRRRARVATTSGVLVVGFPENRSQSIEFRADSAECARRKITHVVAIRAKSLAIKPSERARSKTDRRELCSSRANQNPRSTRKARSRAGSRQPRAGASALVRPRRWALA